MSGLASTSSTSSTSSSAPTTRARKHLKLDPEERPLGSRHGISPIAATISPLLKNQTYSAPNLHFKKTYTHLKEILTEFNWTAAEVDELIVRRLHLTVCFALLTYAMSNAGVCEIGHARGHETWQIGV